MSKPYVVAFDGEKVVPQMNGYKLCCCDCGLVHTIDFEVYVMADRKEDGRFIMVPVNNNSLCVAFTPWRDARATATKRMWKRRKGWKGVK